MPACLRVCVVHACIRACMRACMVRVVHMGTLCMLACMHVWSVCIHVCVSTRSCVRACMHTTRTPTFFSKKVIASFSKNGGIHVGRNTLFWSCVRSSTHTRTHWYRNATIQRVMRCRVVVLSSRWSPARRMNDAPLNFVVRTKQVDPSPSTLSAHASASGTAWTMPALILLIGPPTP